MEISLMNCEINFMHTWSENDLINSIGTKEFAIPETYLYVLVVPYALVGLKIMQSCYAN